MKAIDRINLAGGVASNAEYEEQRKTDEYNALLNRKKQDSLTKEAIAENESGINYLMAETASLRAMIDELVTMLEKGEV